VDAGRDAVLDVGGDGELDAAFDGQAPADGAPLPDARPDRRPDTCPPSEREAGLRVERCRFVREGEASVVPRGIAISGDSLARAARTPLHEPQHYPPLRRDGFDLAWLLVTWDGIEPMPGVYNGAYLGRLCEHAEWAAAAGLAVVLVMYSEGFGPAHGGHGFPRWVSPGAGSSAEAYDRFWADEVAPGRLEAAWARVFDTCAEVHVAGLQPLVAPQVEAAFAGRVEAAAEAVFGPLLVFHNAPMSAAPDSAYAPSVLSPAASIVGAVPSDADSLAAVEAAGAGWIAWHDGFATDALAMRDADGRPNERWRLAAQRTWPVSLAGRITSFGPKDGGWQMSWMADGSAAGLSRVRLGALGPEVTATLYPDGPFDWFTGYDPVTDELSVFVEGAPGLVRLSLQPAAP